MSNQKTEYSILELAVVSQGHSFQQTLHNALAMAKNAESYGYKRFWLAEHHNTENVGSSATSVLIGYVAENTQSIRVGSGGVMLPNHSPLIIAEQFGTLAHLYPGRIDLGLGRAPGTDPQTARAIRSDFMEAAHSFPQEIAKIQQYFAVENQHSSIRATIAEGTGVPLYILGSSTDSAYIAAEKGLPYAFASHFASTHLYNALRIYEQEFKPSKFLQEPYTMAGVNVIIADTDEEAEAQFTTLIRMFTGVITGAKEPIYPPTAMTQEYINMYNHPLVHQMLKFSFVGSKEKVKREIRKFIEETQVNELLAVSNIYAIEDRIKTAKLFGEIMKELNESFTD